MKKLLTLFLLPLCLLSKSYAARTYVGFASDSAVTGNVLPAASMMFGVSDSMNIQTYALIPTIDPFLFSVGANAKFTVAGNQTVGFHLGGGLGFNVINAVTPLSSADDTRDFVVRFNGIAGVHFTVVNRVMVIADGGATLSLNSDKSDADMTFGSNSGLLGLSILYEL